MDGVSSAFAVVSLAIQLVETGEKISKFLSSVQDAPSEVTKLGQTLDQLNSTLKQVSYLLEQQYGVLRLPGSPVFITNALGDCETRIKTLENVIQKANISMDHRNRVHRSWAAMRFVSKKEDIQEMQGQLRDAQFGLQTAMLSNSWQLQMHNISMTSSSSLQSTKIEKPPLAAPMKSVSRNERLRNRPSASNEISRTPAKETNLVWYRGYFGRINIQSKSSSLRRSNTRRPGTEATVDETIITITPIFFRKTLELRYMDSFGRISRTLSTYPILESTAPIFEMCQHGDLQGLQVALSSGSVSPFVLDEYGKTLLHHAANYLHTETCALLLQLGVDSNRRNVHGHNAMGQATIAGHPNQGERMVDTLRLLTQWQNDISPSDISIFCSFSQRPVEAAEFMFSQHLIQSEFDVSEGEEHFPFLAAALRAYGSGEWQWESLIRRLLRKIVDLHVLISAMYPCDFSGYFTPLDELFRFTKTPFEGEAAAARWLRVLSSEGYDVMAYLEEEQALHAAQMQLTRPSCFSSHYDPRELVYYWGSNPSVSWDWWIDPDSSTYLVREEFKHMAMICLPYTPWHDWETAWPLNYPAWSKPFDWEYGGGLSCLDSKYPRYERAQERANRRMRKKLMKVARAQGFRKRDRMPGAWPI